MKNVLRLFMILCIALAGTAVFAQDIQTKGSIGGTVTDVNGGALPNAKVMIEGQQAAISTQTNDQGVYHVDNILPGVYTVTVEQAGFKKSVSRGVTVFVGKEAVINPKLEPGNISEVVTVTDTGGIDQQSSAVNQNLNDQLFANVPVARGVAGLFYLAPGTTDGLGGGRDNPSISGGSALDNLYVADGVNITDSAFGGIGTFSRSYGALGTGINTSFVKEVQVKTAGFEPQYGQATGGIVNIITQSGGNEFHGAFYGFMRPKAFEAKRNQRDDVSTNKIGKILHVENYDVGADAGGPIVKDKLFFFGSFNPSVVRNIALGADNSAIQTILGTHAQRFRTYNYAGKVDWNINSNHSLAFSIFGDPTRTNVSSFASLNIDNLTANSLLDYGSRNMALRYNGTLSPTWTVNASISQGNNHFSESGYADFNQIIDRTDPVRGNFNAIGRGFVEPTQGKTRRFSLDTQKIFKLWGTHSVGAGYQFQRAYYSGNRDRSGPKYTIPATNATGVLTSTFIGIPSAIGSTVNAAWSLRIQSTTNPASCPLCPVQFIPGRAGTDIGLGPGNFRVYLRQDRGEYGDPVFDTLSNYHAGYVQDTWRVNRFVTALVGLRTEQERVIGSPSAAGVRTGFSFTDNWAPRIGVTVDPMGKGKTKVYYNYGRFFEYLPLDLAERSLSAEADFTAGRFAPANAPCVRGGVATTCVTINSFGTVTPVYDAAHFLTAAAGGTGSGVGVSSNDPSNPILQGTKLGFLDEHVFGFEQQLPRNLTFSVRYIDRKLKRIVEDAAVVSPEQFNAGLFGQTYFLANVSKSLDAAINPIPHLFTPGGAIPAACTAGGVSPYVIDPVEDPRTGAALGAVCFEPNPDAGGLGSDGIPDGFPDALHRYRAVEIELNKRFSNNWQLLSNWRIASLKGNYEGHLRNDNGQTDPGISSLFDFVGGEFNLLGDQFKAGPLNTDRKHVANIYGSYQFGNDQAVRGLNIGLGAHMESGLPISEFLAHPSYQNAGEIPVGGRGKLGRTPFFTQIDLHADYPWALNERMKLKFVADFFNVTNRKGVARINEFAETSLGVPNVDFQKARTYHNPFNMRLGLRFEW
jgi:Carboxypeptidase regulatory-like domain